MKIRFELTVDDIIALNRHYIEHSPAAQRALAIWRGMPFLIGLITAILLGLVRDSLESLITGAIVAIVFGGVWCFIAPFVYRRKMERAIRAAFREGKNSGTIGPHELELSDTGLAHRTEFVSSQVQLAAVERVDSIPGYTFINLSALSALIIPHDRVTDGDPEAFTAALKQKLPEAVPATV